MTSGTVRIEKSYRKIKQLLNTIDIERYTLGDSAIFPSIDKATATVIAEKNVKLKSFNIELLMDLFNANPGLCARFYKTIAIKFSNLIRYFGNKKEQERENRRISDISNEQIISESETGEDNIVSGRKDPNAVLKKKIWFRS